MAKQAFTPSSSPPPIATRRAVLGFTAATVASSTLVAAPNDPSPDADLIRICAEHIANREAYNRDGGMGDIDDPDPLWDAYAQTQDAINALKPKTLAGILAKARAAKAEAQLPDGGENADCTPGERWAWQLVGDLLDWSAGA